MDFIWEYDNAESQIEEIIDAMINSRSNFSDSTVLSRAFPIKDPSTRILSFLNDYLRKNSENYERIKAIFVVIRKNYPKYLIGYIVKWISVNSSLDLFERMPFTSMSSGIVSSHVPSHERRIAFWNELLAELLGKHEFLDHVVLVRSYIKKEKKARDWFLEREFNRDY